MDAVPFHAWLTHVLEEEREALEQRHQRLLADFVKRFPTLNCHAACRQKEASESAGSEGAGFVQELDSGAMVEREVHEFQHPTLLESVGPQPFQQAKVSHTYSGNSTDSVSTRAEEPSEGSSRCTRRDTFDLISHCIILASSVCLIFEAEYIGLQRGYDVGYGNYKLMAAQVWPSAEISFVFVDWFFGILFLLEVIIGVHFHRKQFFYDAWNWFDSIVVLLWALDKLVTSDVDPMLLRLARLGRVLRSLRLINAVKELDALFVMTTAIKSSLSILFWSFVLLFAVQLVLALAMNQAMAPFIADTSIPIETRKQLFKHFGTALRAILTMFELTLANWAPVAHLLQDSCGQYWILFSIAHKMSIGLAMVGVINGVLMQETFKVASSDDTIMKLRKNREKRLHEIKMRSFFDNADHDDNAMISWKEFKGALRKKDTKSWLAAQELDASEPELIWYLIAGSKTTEICKEAFVKNMGRLRGSASRMDVVYLANRIEEIAQALGTTGGSRLSAAEPQRVRLQAFSCAFSSSVSL